jgi:anti-sigma-K factor RskA
MAEKNPPGISDEQLDRVGRLLVRSAASGVEEAASSASPFLYARVAARIEERRRAQEDEGWLSLFAVAWRAVPAMAAVAALALALMLWFGISGAGDPPSSPLGDEAALVGARGTGPVSVVLTEGDQLSRDDVFELVVNREVSGAGR